MIQVQFYECEYCHDKFEIEEDCKRCEASHMDTNDIDKDKCVYSYGHVYPHTINITFSDGQIKQYVLKQQPQQPQQLINQTGQSIPNEIITGRN